MIIVDIEGGKGVGISAGLTLDEISLWLIIYQSSKTGAKAKVGCNAVASRVVSFARASKAKGRRYTVRSGYVERRTIMIMTCLLGRHM